MNSEKKYLIFILLIFGLSSVVIQSIFVPFIEVNVWRPDLVLVIVLLIGKRFGALGGSTSGFILGIIQDSLAGMPVGITAMPKAIVGYASGKMRLLRLEGALMYIMFVGLILIHEMISYAFFRYKSQIPYSALLYSRVFPNTVYTTFILLIVHLFTQKYFSEKT